MTQLSASSPQHFVSFDVESFPIKPGLLAPKLVCVSFAVRLASAPADAARTHVDESPNGGASAYAPATGLVLADRGVELFRSWLEKPDIVIVAHNATFDVGVLCAEDPSLVPLVFEAFADHRIRCTARRQEVIDVAVGMRKFRRKQGKITKATYALVDLLQLYFDEYRDKTDTWQLKYGLLADIPIEQWPPEARDYAIDDSIDALRIYDAQTAAMHTYFGSELPNQAAQQQAAWALHLQSMWGLRAEPEATRHFILSCQREISTMEEALKGTGLLQTHPKTNALIRTPTGTPSKSTKAIQARVVDSFGRLGLPVPMTDPSSKFPGGQIRTNTDTLLLTDDAKLHALAAASTFSKHLGQWGPVLTAACLRVICVRYQTLMENGRTSCVAAGTPIEVVRDVSAYPQGVAIERVKVGDLVYSYDKERKLCLRRVLRVIHNGKREVVRVHWRGTGNRHNGFVDLTEDHKVRLTDGQYVSVGDLQKGQRTLALTRGTSQGYARLWAWGTGEISREHRFIYGQVHGHVTEHVHHLNENKLDNRLENLLGETAAEHTSRHATVLANRPEIRFKSAEKMRRLWREGKAYVVSGRENPAWKELTRERADELLLEHRWSIYKAAKADGWSDTIFNKKLLELGYDLVDLKRRADEARLEERRGWARKAREAKALKQKGEKPNHEILSVERMGSVVDVYDLEIEGTHNFIAGEICVHNCGGSEGQEGSNIQNPPRKGEVRPCFVPRPGWVYVFSDADTVELRALAFVCLQMVGYSRMAEVLQRQAEAGGPDLHVTLAAGIVGIAVEASHALHQADDAEFANTRQLAKHVNFALAGGAGSEMFVIMAHGFGICLSQSWTTADEARAATRDGDVSPVFSDGPDGKTVTRWVSVAAELARAAELREIWFQTWPEMRVYFRIIGDMVRQQEGTIRQLVSGRVRGDVRFTAAANSFFSGLVADAMKDSCWVLSYECYTGRCWWCRGRGGVGGVACARCGGSGRSPLLGSRPNFFLHDEPGAEHPEGPDLRARAERQESTVVWCLQKWMPGIPFTSSYVATRRWQKGARRLKHDPAAPVRPEKYIGNDGGTKTRWVKDELVGALGGGAVPAHVRAGGTG